LRTGRKNHLHCPPSRRQRLKKELRREKISYGERKETTTTPWTKRQKIRRGSNGKKVFWVSLRKGPGRSDREVEEGGRGEAVLKVARRRWKENLTSTGESL